MLTQAWRSAVRRHPQCSHVRIRAQWIQRTFATEIPPPPKKSAFQKTKTAAKFAGLFCLSSAFGVVAIGAGILAHDAFTYNERHIDRVPVNPLALKPELGGPKNLPIARVLVDDEEDEEAKLLTVKPKLVIVGGGWGVCLSVHDKGIVRSHSFRRWAFSRPSVQATTMLLWYLQTHTPYSPHFFLVSPQSIAPKCANHPTSCRRGHRLRPLSH